MKIAYLIIFLCACTFSMHAQQDLRDPRYIYSLDEEDRYGQAVARGIASDTRVAVYYNGRIYKDVHLQSFLYDSSLIYHERRFCFSRREKRQYTKERGIKRLYVVGEYDPMRKLLVDDPEFRKYINSVLKKG